MSLRNSLICDVAKEVSQISKGTKLLHEVLAKKLEEKPGTNGYRSKIDSLRSMLEKNYGIFFDTCRKEGYIIVETDKSWKCVDGSIEKAKRLTAKKLKRIELIPINNMSEPARNEAFTGMQKHSTLMIMLNVGSRVKQLE